MSVSTTGVSAIIDNNGKVRQITKQNMPLFVSGDISLNTKESVSSRIGNWSPAMLLLIALSIYLRKRRLSE